MVGPPQSAAYHSLDGHQGYNVTRGFAPEQQQQQFAFGPQGGRPQMGYQQQSLFGRK